jgi:hypothetical protein
MTCAAIGVDAGDLDLPVPLDKRSYRAAVTLLSDRGLVDQGRLTNYGRQVEEMPVERPWGELLVHADPPLLPVVAVAANIDSLHRMTRDDRNLQGLIVPGSDHLTAYNVFAEAVNKHGDLGVVYGLPRHLFRESIDRWAEGRGVLVKAIEDIALGTASVYRQLELPLPAQFPAADDGVKAAFADLLAKVAPFDVVIDEATADGQEARVSRGSVCGSWGAIAGTLRYFADRFGNPRAAIEGTQIPERSLRRYARRAAPQITFERHRRHEGLMAVRTVEYQGFLLEREVEALAGEFPADLAAAARQALGRAVRNGGTPHPDQPRISRALHRAASLWSRSGGTLSQLAPDALEERLATQLASVASWETFLRTRLSLEVDELVTQAERARLDGLPQSLALFGDRVAIDYAVEDGQGVARLHLKEGQARRLREGDLPMLDRPLRFTVIRGKREAARADSIADLQKQLTELPKGKPKGGRAYRPPRRRRR